MKTTAIAALATLLAASPALAQTAPAAAPAKPAATAPTKATAPKAAGSTPESRSAEALALPQTTFLPFELWPWGRFVLGTDDFQRQVTAGFMPWQLISYSGAQHAFTLPEANSPEHGAAYHPVAERRSWAAMRAFFDEIFA